MNGLDCMALAAGGDIVETFCVSTNEGGKKIKRIWEEQAPGCRRSYLVGTSADLLLNLLGSMEAGCFSFNSYEWQFHKSRQFQSVRSQGSRAEHQLAWAGNLLPELRQKMKVYRHWKQKQATWDNYSNAVAWCTEKLCFSCMQSKFNWSPGWAALWKATKRILQVFEKLKEDQT